MKIENIEQKNFFSFDKNYSALVKFIKPSKFKELELISNSANDFINVGSNLSYSPLAFSKKSISLALKSFNRIISFDLEKKEITVESGITLAELLNFTLKYNLWIPQLPGYPLITLGGAIATNAHGKSCAVNGTIRNSIKDIQIFHKSNGWLNLSKDENKDIFELTLGGLGLTGTIINVTLNLQNVDNTDFITIKNKVSSMEECIQMIKKKSNKKDSFVYSWNMASNISNLGKGIVFENIISKKEVSKKIKIPEKKNKIKFKPYFSLWNKTSISIANKIFFETNFLLNNKKESFIDVIFPFYGKESYFHFFGKNGFFESQFLIPDGKIDEFLDEFKYLFKIHSPVITLLSFKNMSGEQKYLRFEDNMICMTLDYVNNKKNKLFMSEIDKLCIKYNILPSIIKDSRLDKKTFENCYKNLVEFKKEINKYDVNRYYKSETSERLGI